jgi:hypothetical protein
MLCWCPRLVLSEECYATCTGMCWTFFHTAQTIQCATYMSSPPQVSAIKTGPDWWRSVCWCGLLCGSPERWSGNWCVNR